MLCALDDKSLCGVGGVARHEDHGTIEADRFVLESESHQYQLYLHVACCIGKKVSAALTINARTLVSFGNVSS